jgi:transposase
VTEEGAVAGSMLTAAYHMLKNGVEFEDLGELYFAHRNRTKLAKRLVRRLEDIGFAVNITAAA